MRVLWLCNLMIPTIAKRIGAREYPYGGWITGQLNGFSEQHAELQLAILCPYESEIEGSVDEWLYYTFTNKSKAMTKRFEYILEHFQPDIVHMFGTEYKHSLCMYEVCRSHSIEDKCVVSIQGLVSIYAKHFYSALPLKDVLFFSLRDLLKRDNVLEQKKKYEKRSASEVEVLKKIQNVIGRTEWDYACSKMYNDQVQYYLCNEILRPCFYSGQWDYEQCEKHSIFITQSNYPIKGFHLLLEAIAIVIKKYPNLRVYTTGVDLFKSGIKDKIKRSHYQNMICRLIKKYKLENNISFLGELTDEEVKKRLLLSNIFVMPSSIENSPNSLGESMLLGVPIVAANVGGINCMLDHGMEGYLYQYDAPYMLAYYISKLFSEPDTCRKVSQNARKRAFETHDIQNNTCQLLEAYNHMLLK